MTAWLIAYSDRGCDTALRAAEALEKRGCACRVFASEKHRVSEAVEALTVPCADWAGAGFAEADALIFCCAAGIAVRGIAKHVRSKKTDPAVIVVDETGRFVISLLSGHIGGANALASELAADLGATPVITTATDLNGLFAVDVFAEKNHLYIESMALAKEVSAALLAGEAVGFCSDLPVRGELPPELTEDPSKASIGVCVTADASKAPWERTLRLIPKRYAAGLGCRRGKDTDEMARFFAEKLAENGVDARALRCLASVDLKADEPCLLALAEQYRLPFVTYSAAELNALPGSFSGSDFVKGVTGVDCVSERAAALAAGGRIVCKKTAGEGMTFALAEYEEDVCFG